MSDEPQPQQPTPGWAPREPQPDGDPGTPRAQADDDPSTARPQTDGSPATPRPKTDDDPSTPQRQTDDAGTPKAKTDGDPSTPRPQADDDPGTVQIRAVGSPTPATPRPQADDDPGTVQIRAVGSPTPATPPTPAGDDPGTAPMQAIGDPDEPQAKPGGKPKRTGWRRMIPTWRMTLGGFIIVVLLLVGGFFLGYSLVKIPPANALATKQANVYLYADGSVIARDGEVNRENVTLAQISKDAQHAILAAEDRDFYTESAVDPKAMVRAAWNTATRQGQAVRLHDHPAVREELLPAPGTDRHAQGQGILHLHQAGPREEQGPHPRGLPQHQLLRPQRLRHPGRRPGLLRHGRQGPRPGPRRLPRRARQRAQPVRRRRPPREPQGRRVPLGLRPGRHGQEGLAQRVRSGPA